MKILKPVIAVVILAAAAGGILYFFNSEDGAPGKVNYSTQPLGRADLVKSISATGTVEPEELVNVGAQVSGKITVFEKDADGKAVDYGSPEKEGMVLARIDDPELQSQYRTCKSETRSREEQLGTRAASVSSARDGEERL